jgi:hypothetical protein
MHRQPEAWGGEVRLPKWTRRLLRRASPTDTPEARSEADRPDPSDAAKLQHMQAAGTLAPHHSELPRPDPRRPRSR